jgi:primosomal protein N' (replication factor Y)
MARYVGIALPVRLNRLFTYCLPTALDVGTLSLVGCRVLVPFGKRTLTGVVIEEYTSLASAQKSMAGHRHTSSSISSDDATIKDIGEIFDITPVFSNTMLDFARWIAEYYVCSLGDTLKAMLPQGMSPESVLRVRMLRSMSDEELVALHKHAPRRAQLFEAIRDHAGTLSVSYIARRIGAEHISVQLEALEREGFILRERITADSLHPRMRKAVLIPPVFVNDDDEFQHILTKVEAQSPKQARALSAIYMHYQESEEPFFVADLCKQAQITSSVVSALVQKGYAEEYMAMQKRVFQTGTPTLAQRDEAQVELTIEQLHAVDKINQALDAQTNKTFLLHGVTGSGKTLVYMRAIAHARAQGKSSLLLVPEIALTPQLIDRFKAVFGEDIGVLHSKVSAGERYDAWHSAARGEAMIVIGARSAVFVPMNNIGLIIVDEEHEPSYKQDAPEPRYHARDCAIIRGRIEKAVVVLGSATPSLESMYNAQAGKYHLLNIHHRADGAQLPVIRVVDIITARKQRTMRGSFSSVLITAIAERLHKKEGVILYQNRRGFASRLECHECGTIPECPNCSVALTYHKFSTQVRCHYCGYNRRAEQLCGSCGSHDVHEVGAGTQRIEEELRDILADMNISAVIERMDLDTTSKKGSHKTILHNFAERRTDILIGTQMVAKGLDFSHVTLVGVLYADMSLFVPDFRAGERTYQLLTQVAGRAGRSGEHQGEVIIQTTHPKHQSILAVQAGNYDMMYNDELQERRELMYPPYMRFVVIEFSGKDDQLVQMHANYFAGALPKSNQFFQRLGPAYPTIVRLRNVYRRLVVIKSSKEQDPRGEHLRNALYKAYRDYRAKHHTSAIHITINIDAQGVI